MKQYNILVALFTCLLLSACEKVINIDLKNAAPQLVIEGIVDNSGNPAKVTIAKSVAFSNRNAYPPVTGAVIKISDNAGNVFNLTETQPGTYTNSLLKGVAGRTYTLIVTAEGQNYTASSAMPLPVALDTLEQEKLTVDRTYLIVNALFEDPAGFGNNYHFIQTINGKRNPLIYILDDSYSDGGPVVNQLLDQEDNRKLKAGDVVQVEMQCVNSVFYRYLRGLVDLQDNNTVPANPETNINNNALGYFSAHTSQKKTIVIR